jgi:HEAT repeat protein
MSNIEFNPIEVYNKRQELGLSTAVQLLIQIINSQEELSKRKEAIKIIGSIEKIPDNAKEVCFQTLENVIISEKTIELKCEAARSMGKIKLKKSLEPLKWILENSSDALDAEMEKTVLKAIHSIRFEKPEIDLFIKYLDSDYKVTREYVSYELLNLPPNEAINMLLESFNTEISNSCKIEVVKLIGKYISSLNVSYNDSNYLKIKHPAILESILSHKKDFTSLLSLIDKKDKELIKRILTIFRLLGNEINSELIELVKDEEFIAKENAIYLIGKLKIKSAMGLLLENIDNMYSEISIASIKALADIGDASIIPELLKSLNVEDIDFEYIDMDMKWYIIDTIKQIYLQDENISYETLLSQLDHPNEILKESIAYILGELGNKQFVEPLLALLKRKENIDVKKNAIIALGKIGGYEAIEPLITYAENPKVYWLLKKIVIDAVLNIYNDNWYQVNSNEEIRRLLIKNRARLSDYLKEHNNECYKIKLGIIKFLEKFGDKAAIDALFANVNDFHRIVQISAQNAIKSISERLEEPQN